MRRVLGQGTMGMLDGTLWLRIVLAAASLLLLLAGRSSGEDKPAGDDPTHGYQHPGVRDLLPAFREDAARRLSFPYSRPEWSKRNGRDFGHWRRQARARVQSRFLAAPPAVPFHPAVIASRRRRGYTSHKIAFNLTADSRVLAYLLVPDGRGPHPAVLLLHDHGAEFRIGKEKSVEPWDVPAEKAARARKWVDRRRIAAMGHSMGAFRTWQVAAVSDHIAAGVSCCWMATVKGLMVPGNNQTKGQSSFTMTHPGLFNDLDYPDVASLACPKPMLFFAGEGDALFPAPSVKTAFARMHRVWGSQGAGDRPVTRLLPVGHAFNAAMQDEAFEWLDRRLRQPAADPEGTEKDR